MSAKTSFATETIPDDIRKLLEEGKLDAVEDAWMNRAESEPDDLAWFAAVAEGVTKADTAETAAVLFQMLDDQLVDQALWSTRLELLRFVGKSIFKANQLHEAIVTCLEEQYSGRTHYAAMFEMLGLDKAKDDIQKTWQKVGRLEGLMAFDVGAIVRMRDKGAGRIDEVNMALGNFKVALDGGLELRVGFGGAAKLLQPLPEDHVLRRKLEEPETLEQLAKDDPSELLRLVLEGEEGSMTGAEIKKVLTGIVSPRRWSSFWTAARKHPQVITDPKNKRAYTWAESTADAHGTLWQAFLAAEPREKITMLRRDAERDADLEKRMSAEMAIVAAKVMDREPGLAAEIWLNLERWGSLPPGEARFNPKALISDAKANALPALIDGVGDRVIRERVYEMVRELRQDWRQMYTESLWQETEARSLDLLTGALLDVEPTLFESFFDQLVSQPRKAPASFTWLVERAGDRPEWMARNPLRLLQQLLFALSNQDFAPFRAARLVPLAESGGTLPRLLDHLSADQAESALETVKRSPALEDYQREPLINAIHLRLPDLHKERETPLYATSASISAKRAELKELAEKEIPENRQAIESARELGDLRENFEYHAARRRHEYLSARAGKLDQDLRRVRPIDPSTVTGKEIVIGARITFRNAAGDEAIYTILGPWESDPEQNVLSNESDLAQKLLGTGVGATVELPGGEYEVATIEPWSSRDTLAR
ncbi:MAG: GreA/GreB family elongation factor [Holophagales bacterium]|nr:GreA/GreB family elongation factor [Holophagales bacterium]